MTAKHTPGPWKINTDEFGAVEVWSGNASAQWDAYIADAACDDGLERETQIANAKLLAAAPALTDALELLHAMWLVHKTVTLNQVAITAIENALRAAGRLP